LQEKLLFGSKVELENVLMPLFSAKTGLPTGHGASFRFPIDRSVRYFERERMNPKFSELTGKKLNGEYTVLRHINGALIIVAPDEAQKLIEANSDWQERQDLIPMYKKNRKFIYFSSPAVNPTSL
jgi:hypothetical protein